MVEPDKTLQDLFGLGIDTVTHADFTTDSVDLYLTTDQLGKTTVRIYSNLSMTIIDYKDFHHAAYEEPRLAVLKNAGLI